MFSLRALSVRRAVAVPVAVPPALPLALRQGLGQGLRQSMRLGLSQGLRHSGNTLRHTRLLHTGKSLLQENDGSKHLGSFKVDQPQIMIAFTCKKCDTRSSHVMSKQAYTGGTVLITCPGCKNRHLIADHLKIFNDDKITIEDIMKAQGESVSQSTEDLAFEDIPDSLRDMIGHHAKDAPEKYRNKLDNETVHQLPDDKN